MRIFVPFQFSDLVALQISPRIVHGVTPQLQQLFANLGEEELEYVATQAAADDSLRQLDPAGEFGFRRLLGVAEASNSLLRLPQQDEQLLETAIYLEQPLDFAVFESFLVDEPGSEELVQRAVAGDEAAFLATEDIELLWYDAQEAKMLYTQLSSAVQ